MNQNNKKGRAPTPKNRTAQPSSQSRKAPGGAALKKNAPARPGQKQTAGNAQMRKRKTAALRGKNDSTQKKARQNVRPPSAAETARRRQIQTSQRKKRRKYKHNYTIYYVMLAILLTVTGIALSLTVFFRIESIEISGSNYYTAAQVEPMLLAKKGDNLLRYNAVKEEKGLMQALSRAEDISVRKKFPNTLLVEITDGLPVKQIYSGGSYYYIGEQERILYSGGEPLPNVTVYFGVSGEFQVGGYLSDSMDEESLRRFTEISSAIEEKMPGAISLVNMTSTVDIHLCYENRIQVDIGSMSQLSEKLDMLRETMAGGEIDDAATGVMDLNQANMLVFNSLAEMDAEMGLAADWK